MKKPEFKKPIFIKGLSEELLLLGAFNGIAKAVGYLQMDLSRNGIYPAAICTPLIFPLYYLWMKST
jgi:hypothetical protein